MIVRGRKRAMLAIAIALAVVGVIRLLAQVPDTPTGRLDAAALARRLFQPKKEPKIPTTNFSPGRAFTGAEPPAPIEPAPTAIRLPAVSEPFSVNTPASPGEATEPAIAPVAPRYTITLQPPDAALRPSDAPPRPEELPPRPADLNSGKRFAFNFRAAPWEMVLKKFAESFGLALQLNAIPPGTFNYIDDAEFTSTEALDILNGYLIQTGHFLVRNGRFLYVLAVADGIPQQLIPEILLNDLSNRGNNELVSVALPVNNLEVTVLAKEVQPLLSRLGQILALTRTQHLIVTDTGANIRKIQNLIRLSERQGALRPVAVYHLNNTKSPDIAKAIMDFLVARGQLSAAGPGATGPIAQVAFRTGGEDDISVVAEASTNSVLISGPARMMPLLDMLVRRLDHSPTQVVIQAMLVEVELGNTDEFGIELGGQDSVLFDRSVLNNLVTATETVSNPATGIATTNQRILSQEASPGFQFNNAPLGNNVAIRPNDLGRQALSNFGVGRVNGELGFGGLVFSASSNQISMLMRALSATRKVDVLSRPQIRTVNHQKAQIQIGQQVPVVDGVSVTAVGSANPIIRQDRAGIILDVTPRIGPDGSVSIEVEAEKSEYQTARGSGVPIFVDATSGNIIEAPIKDITKAKATVSIFSGQTIVLGGMISRNITVVNRKVPVLGDIPLLGALFRYDLEKTRRRELLIFLTPRVVTCDGDSGIISNVEATNIMLPPDAEEMHRAPLFPRFTPPTTVNPQLPPNGNPPPPPQRELFPPPGYSRT